MIKRLVSVKFTTISFCWVGLLALSVPASATPIDPGFDLLSSPEQIVEIDPDGAGSLPELPILVEGDPIPDAHGADTIIERTEGLAGSTGLGTIDAEIVALSLVSVDPVEVDGDLFDVSVILDSDQASTGGISVTQHTAGAAGSGLFDSFFDVFVDITLTEVTNPSNQLIFEGVHETTSACPINSATGLNYTICSTQTPWSHVPPPGYPDDPQFPAGGFYITTAGIDHDGPHPKVEATSVSEPPLVWLFGIGLGLLGWGRWSATNP